MFTCQSVGCLIFVTDIQNDGRIHEVILYKFFFFVYSEILERNRRFRQINTIKYEFSTDIHIFCTLLEVCPNKHFIKSRIIDILKWIFESCK